MQPEPKVNILLVDDHPENLLALEAVLSSLGEDLVKATSGEEALRRMLHQDFAVILLDVQMPGIDGFETATLIRSRARSRQTPIIFLTAFSTSEQLMFKGYSLGAVDYLHKPIDAGILTSKVTVFVELFKKTEAIKQQAAQLQAINAELRQSEERFRSLSASSPVGIFVTDTEGHCTYTNRRFQAICGSTPVESLGEGWLRPIHPEDQDRVRADWAVYLTGEQDYSDEFRFQLADGSIRWVHMRSSPMLSDQGEPLGHAGTLEDITERKQAEEIRSQVIREQAARREAEAANRMKDEFLAVLSHELRTPLNSMLGWSRLLRTKKFDEQTTARALETIERNAVTQAQLIDDILDVSQIIRGKLRLNYCPLNLTSIVESAIEAVRPLADAKTIKLDADLQLKTGQVWGDPVRLQQVVWNLLTNAIKFTSEQGTVAVKLEIVPKLDETANANNSDSNVSSIAPTPRSSHSLPQFASLVFHPTEEIQIQVSDTGIGISPDFLPNVFDRFRQADSTTTRSHNGLGLGLAIVRHLAELHGGTVRAESPGEGQGATFTVRLPLLHLVKSSDAPEALDAVPSLLSSFVASPTTSSMNGNLATASSGKPTTPVTGLRVLVVDDEVDSRNFLTFVLQQHGAVTATAASTADALGLLDEFCPNILVSDIGMPEEDGYALIRQIRSREQEQGRCLLAVALTAYSRAEDREQALAAGFQAHLAKPVEVIDLIQTINEALNSQQNPAEC